MARIALPVAAILPELCSLYFFKWRIFFNSLLFSGKTAFLQISAKFATRFEKIFFSSEISLDKDANRCKTLFCSSIDSGDMREKHKFQK